MPERHLKLNRTALALAGLIASMASAPAFAASCTWNSTTGNWNELAKWLACVTGNGNPGGVPGAADSATIGATGVVTVNTAQNIGAVANAGSLIVDGSSLRVTGGITGSGSTTIQGNGLLNLENTQTVDGNATIIFGSGFNNRLGIDGGNKVVTFAAGTTVRGQSGSIGLGQVVNGSGNSILNQGLISSDSGGTINIIQSTLVNQNIAEATGAGSVLRFDSEVINTGGTLRSTAGGVVMQNGATITGGSITNSGGGTFQAANNGNNFLSGVTLTAGSQIDLASAQSLVRVNGGMTLNGTLNINSSSLINFEGDQTLAGGGSIVFGGTSLNNRVGIDGGNKTLTVASGVTIRGENGVIGVGQLLNGSGNRLVNNGTISADVAGGVITLAQSAVTNNGTISAQNGGTLQLQSNLTGGVGSQLVAGAGSVISQQGVTISGVVNTSGSGSLRPTVSTNNFLSGVTINGNLDMASAVATERVVGNLVLNGSINVNSASLLNFEGDQTLSGNGSLVFGNTASNNRIGVDGGNKTLTVASGITIRGENGIIGVGQLVNGSGNALVNNGTISADVAGGVITLAQSTVTNNGTISAQNGGTLQLQSDLVGGVGGQLVAGAGSVILQQGVTISGVINTSGSGNLRPSVSTNNFLSGATLNGNLDMASAVATERVLGNLVLNGTINVNNASLLNFEGNQTLSGNGNIVFGSTASNNRVGVDGGNKTLTLANGITIQGVNGTIGVGQLVNGSGNTLVNQGLISSDGGGTISLAGASFVNQSMAQAVGAGSVLQLNSAVDNSAGVLRSTGGGVVLQNGVTVTGGNITNSGGGTYRVSVSSVNFLSGVTLTSGSNIDMATAVATGRVINGMTLNGTLNLGSSSLLNMEGDQTLMGTGSIVLGAGANNRVGVDGGNKTLTIASGVTIRGVDGSIGVGQLINGSGNSIINNGVINSDGGGTITVQGLGGGMANNGLLRAQSGTLNVATVLTGTGTLQVDATGSMILAAGAKSQGVLAMGASGAALNLSTGNLTISSDYTNVGAGSGNSFNRRAGVTGTGLIVAGGNVAQVITGAGVAGGTTANATLTVGNMRVGANTFNVQIGNAGTTGATLRGAIQTSDNGGNITDARLSGTAVTASNYNAGAPGGNSGNLGVTFTAASAGALAPLTGQAINLRSNFENIADQRLNIVMGAGAAAYNAAVGSTAPSPVQVANQRVGGSNSAALTVSNTAAAGSFSEDLRASFGSNTGAATNNGGSTNALVAGGNNGSALSVGVNTGVAGARTGSVTVNYQTTGTVNGVSNGLGLSGANPAQTITVNGNVYQAAAGAIQTAALNFGTVQVGQSVSQALVIRNSASGAAGFVEDLNAGFGVTSGTGATLISGSGSLNGILAGANSTAGNGSMVVSVNTAAAGNINGSILVNYSSAGAVGGASNGLGTLGVGSEGYGVNGTIQASGNVINQASPLVNNPTINLGAVRVGAAAPSGTVSVTNVASAPPQAALNAAIAPTSGPITASGSFNLLNPGATNNGSLVVGLNTATAGNFTGGNAGTATINFVSDASNVGGCAPNCQLNLASQTVNVAGKVYTQAVGAASGTAINFGVVRVGDTVSAANITISNTAASTALNDSLRADVAGIGGAFSAPASVAGIAAQTAGQLAVGLNTASAGIFSQTGSIGLSSHNADMADVSAGANAVVSLMAQVNNLANGDFDLLSGTGTLSQTGTRYVLDLGTIVLGDTVATTLRLDNDVAGPADALSGLFDLAGADDFSYSGWNPLAFLAAGQASGNLNVNWLAGALGLFSDTIIFNGLGTNASDPLGLAQTRQLTIRANVINGVPPGTVPEPGTLALLLGAAAAGLLARRRGFAQGAQGAAR